MLVDTSAYIRAAQRTTMHIESTAIDSSNNWDPSLDYMELDHVKVDPSMYKRDYETYKPETHLYVGTLDPAIPQGGTCITDALLDDLIERLQSGNPYKKEYEAIAQAVENFKNGSN